MFTVWLQYTIVLGQCLKTVLSYFIVMQSLWRIFLCNKLLFLIVSQISSLQNISDFFFTYSEDREVKRSGKLKLSSLQLFFHAMKQTSLFLFAFQAFSLKNKTLKKPPNLQNQENGIHIKRPKRWEVLKEWSWL